MSCQTLDRLPALEVHDSSAATPFELREPMFSYPRFSPQVATCIAVVRAPLLPALDCLHLRPV